MSGIRRLARAAVAVACLATGIVLAGAHPLWPRLVLLAFLGAVLLSGWKPRWGLLALPAAAPFLDFAPWTGWQMADEFDLLVLAVLAGGYFGSIHGGKASATEVQGPAERKMPVCLALVAACLIARGAAGLSLPDFNGFAAYDAPLNALRVGKSFAWIALLAPLLAASDAVPEKFFRAALLGAAVAVLGVFWERAFFPGLLDLRTPYRTVGLFWEMHHGGAALDVYLVLMAPLVAWAWRQTLSTAGRLLLGIFILAFVYACLTTFSRGAVFTAGGAVVLQGLLYAWRAYRQGSLSLAGMRASSLWIVVLAGIEVFAVFGTDSFMNSRMQESGFDFGGRLAHWQRALGALKSPGDWLFGIGPGKFPAREVQRELGVRLAGGFEAADFSDGTRGIRLYGPDGLLNGRSPGGYFAVSQRIDPGMTRLPFRFSLKARGRQGGQLLVRVCASHLLYPARCDSRIVSLQGEAWQQRRVWLSGRTPRAESGWRTMSRGGHGVFLVSALTPGAIFDLSEMKLERGGQNLLSNTNLDPAQGRWFPQSFRYFLPWRVDNLYLEILVEMGLAGLAVFLGFILSVSRGLLRAYRADEAFSAEFIACGAGVLVLGSVVSILDMPRVATLAGLFFVRAWIAGFVKSR